MNNTTTIGLNCSASHPQLTAIINNIIKVNTNNMQYLKTEINKEKINVDDINDYIEKLTNPVIDNLPMVGIIHNFDKVSVNNQNKLLKTIENNQQIQIFIYEKENEIIDTIKSRILIYKINDEINTQDPFLQIFNQSSVFYLENDQELYKIYKNIYNLCNENKFQDAFIIYKIKIKHPKVLDAEIILTILLQSLYNLKNYQLFKKIQLFEWQINKNLNINLLIDTMFITILKD